VTEAITGVDLVEWQLRVASGEALPVGQSDLSIAGHAIEARLYAEDAAAGFLPATGRLAHLRFAEGARADTGVGPGDEITPWYDPMIAKLIVHGPRGRSHCARWTVPGDDRGCGRHDEPRLPATCWQRTGASCRAMWTRA
jgi:acetyl/propionyl-CoA carboxylase alpha subunit